MVKLGKKKNIFIVFLAVFVFICSGVYAATNYTVVFGHTILFGYNNGVYTTVANNTSGTKYKTLNGKPAYCTQLDKQIENKNFSVDSSFNRNSKNAIIAGKVIEIVNARSDWNSDAKYLYITELVNYIFKYDGSKNFVNNNSELRSIHTEALNYYNNTVKNTNKLSSITLTGDVNMNSTSVKGNYISSKITLSGLVSNYGSGVGNTNKGDTRYVVSVSGDGNEALICSDALGKNCSGSSVVLEAPANGNYDFYVKVSNGVSGGSVKVNVSGSNKSDYKTVIQYVSNAASQKLVLAGTTTISRTVSTALNLNIPDNNNHIIKFIKVDAETNEQLAGADLELYRVDSQKNESILTAKNNGAIFSYSVSKASDQDDFFKYQYCAREKKAPSGYVRIQDPYCFTPTKGETSKGCYDISTGDSVSELYCGSAQYVCEDSNAEGPNASHKCVSTSTNSPKLVCDSEGYELNTENKCVATAEASLVCESGYTLDQTNNKCVNDEDLTVINDPSLTCGSGYTLNETDGKCYIYEEPSKVCENGTLSGEFCIIENIVDAVCKVDGESQDSKYCENPSNYMLVSQDGDNVTLTVPNKKTSVTISKQDIYGESEIPGASLKVCTTKPDENGDCDVATIMQSGLTCPTYTDEFGQTFTDNSNCSYDEATNTRTIGLSWVSTTTPRTWTGLETEKTYYLVEKTPPKGYIGATITTEFVINVDGSISVNGKKVSDNQIVIKNELTKMSISKQDFVTSKEIPGATLSICESHIDDSGKLAMSLDDYGNCTVVTLADGTAATWISGEEPHKIEGLEIGTYYLVEKIAPDGYETAESIIFVMNADGTVSDENGKKVGSDNKIVMYDKPIDMPPTGDLPIILLVVLIAGVSGWIYHTIKVNNGLGVSSK